MTPSELYQAGNLTDAVAAALEEVKSHPTDTAKRGFLCELLLFTGELEKIDRQLETIGKQDADALIGVSLLRQLVRGETARQQFYSEGRLPEFLGEGEVSDELRLHLDASIALREGNGEEAARLLAEAEEKRVHVRGTCDGKPFDDLRDVDDLTASFFEVVTSNGKYYWVALDRITSIEFHEPQRPQDLFWRRAHMIVREGPDGEVYLPAIYPGTHTSEDDQLRLGRGTDWIGDEGSPARGAGLRMLLVGDEDKTILQLGNIEFEENS